MLLLAASLAVVQVACDRSADGGLITPLTRATGALVVRVQPGGNSIDPDGFSVTLDGQTRPVAFDAPARFDTLVAGQHVARLTDLAAHCSASPDSVTATIRAGVTDTVAVTVFCIGGVAFNSDGSGSSEIDYLREDGRTIRLTSGPGLKSIGAWSPDGSRLLFTNSDYASFNSDLFSVRSDGTDLKQLTSGTGSAARWSPDGTRIAFTQYVEGVHDDEPWIVVMDADGTNQRNLLDLSWNAFRPVWAPDGSELYFTCYRAGIAFAICASAPDGTGLRTIRFDALSPRFPVPVQASPDGRAISFSDLNMTWVGMLDGSSAIPLTPGDDSFAAKWAPTSDRLLLSVADETSKFGLATVNRDGTGYRLLTGFTTDPAGDWSPDGSLIAFSAARAGSTQIMVMNADGTGVRPLTEGALNKHTPVWNPKSRPAGPLFVRIGK